MFTVRPYKEEDAAACGDCFYEGFFSCSVDQNDKILLRDYAQILIEKMQFHLCCGNGGSSGRRIHLWKI